MHRSPERRDLEGSSGVSIAATFCACLPLLSREIKDLAKYGAPAAVPASALVRAAYVEFDECGFEFNKEGQRALLFLITDDRGEATNILAWAPQLDRLESWHQTSLTRCEDETGAFGFGRYQSAM